MNPIENGILCKYFLLKVIENDRLYIIRKEKTHSYIDKIFCAKYLIPYSNDIKKY